MSTTRGGSMNSDKEGLSNLLFCNTVLICVVFTLSLEFAWSFIVSSK